MNQSTNTSATVQSMNQSTNTSATQTLDLLTKSLAIACDMAPADIDTSEHLQVREFLLTACAVVVILTAFNSLKSMVKRIGNYGKRKAKSNNRRKKNQSTKVTPKSKEAENDDGTDTHVETINNTIDTHAETIKDGKGGEIYEMMIHFLQALLTIYSVINYWYHYMPNLDGKDVKTQILCRATHMSIMPLFKPVSISMWPALMPLIQLLHWTLHKDKALLNYQDFVLPGTQPFQFNWLSWMYVYLVGICWCVYMVATVVYWPLILISSWILIPLVYAIPFVCLHLPVQVLNGRGACCRCRLGCWKKSGVRKLDVYEEHKLAEHFGISQEKLEERARDASAESDSSVGMLTLKALTVLYLVLTVTSMYFLPVYYGQIGVYNDMVNAFQMEFGFVPVFEFVTIHFDFQFLFRWPDTLRIDFQIVLFFSISLIIFERMVAVVMVIDEYMQEQQCTVERKHFQPAIWMVRVPYWFGESYYKLFEMGWEILVMVYGLVACLLYYLPYLGLYMCFQSERKYPFRKVDLWAVKKGLEFGFYDAVGKSGWYIILKKVFKKDRQN